MILKFHKQSINLIQKGMNKLIRNSMINIFKKYQNKTLKTQIYKIIKQIKKHKDFKD